jgi:hypothetical protein
VFRVFFSASSLLFRQKYKQNYRAFQNKKIITKQEGINQRNKAILSIVLRVKTVQLTSLVFVELVFISTSFGQKRAK